jgi:flagellar basal-body rod protein FlgB
MEIIAGNLANSTTPNYHARDIDYKDFLKEFGDKPRLAVTQQGHVEIPQELTDNALRYRIPLSASKDGNTVEGSIEEAAYGDSATRYLASLRFAESALSGMRKAYRGD